MRTQKKLLLVLTTVTFMAYLLQLPINTCQASTISQKAISTLRISSEISNSSDASICADILQWLYKIEDGKVYRRLYNASTAEWIGDWIYVGEYNPAD